MKNKLSPALTVKLVLAVLRGVKVAAKEIRAAKADDGKADPDEVIAAIAAGIAAALRPIASDLVDLVER